MPVFLLTAIMAADVLRTGFCGQIIRRDMIGSLQKRIRAIPGTE